MGPSMNSFLDMGGSYKFWNHHKVLLHPTNSWLVVKAPRKNKNVVELRILSQQQNVNKQLWTNKNHQEKIVLSSFVHHRKCPLNRLQGPLDHQPKPCTLKERKIFQISHTFAMFYFPRKISILWWFDDPLTIPPFHTYHPTPPRVPSRDRSRERRGGERSRRIDPDLWGFCWVHWVHYITTNPKNGGTIHDSHISVVFCRASWWIEITNPPKKRWYTMKNGCFWFFNFHFQPPKTGVMNPFFQGGLPMWLLQIKMVSWIQEKLSFKLPCEHGFFNNVSTPKI